MAAGSPQQGFQKPHQAGVFQLDASGQPKGQSYNCDSFALTKAAAFI
jgi:hypothetical protein